MGRFQQAWERIEVDGDSNAYKTSQQIGFTSISSASLLPVRNLSIPDDFKFFRFLTLNFKKKMLLYVSWLLTVAVGCVSAMPGQVRFTL
ncbi:hypothetical protein CDAR_180871 [Caerostris darwini]|uniref:Uncharacterized protein n=1 Tax=Caerostris darwini TaxID=1538125 RepID=A0AAV4VL25_9ARAC|nr:hypothetical protein CDAR_180871 [Caerostris darwini]